MKPMTILVLLAAMPAAAQSNEYRIAEAERRIAEIDAKIAEKDREYAEMEQRKIKLHNDYEERRVTREPSEEETKAMIRFDESFSTMDSAYSGLKRDLLAERASLEAHVAGLREAAVAPPPPSSDWQAAVERTRRDAQPPAEKPRPTRLDAATVARYRAEAESRQGGGYMGAIFWLLLGALVGYAASQRKGFSPVAGLLGGALLGLLSPLLFLVSGTGIKGADGKKCPDCAESVKVDARVCKHCGKRFDAPPSAA